MVIMDRQDYIIRLTVYLTKTLIGQYLGIPLTPLKINALVSSKGLKIKQG